MAGMFATPAEEIKGLNKLDTSNVTDMIVMFATTVINKLDLSNFDTSKVTSMGYMFYYSTNLKTIYVSDKFNINAVTDSDSMFDNCPNLVGGAGTVYDSTKIDKTYARIDGGTSSPGYFTRK